MGPKEAAVRATLANRPASILYLDGTIGHQINRCFAGLFNGARQGHLTPNGGLFLGKAECEWDWEEVWPALQALELVEYRLEEVPAPGAVSGKMTKFHWSITDKGHDVREDDIKYFRELMDARTADEAAEQEAQ